jgi:hypothetical protein
MSLGDAESVVRNTASTLSSSNAFTDSSAPESTISVFPPGSILWSLSNARASARVPLPGEPIANRFPLKSERDDTVPVPQ